MPVTFDEHYFAYRVKKTTDWLIFSPGEEVDYHALDIYKTGGNLYIPLRHKVTSKTDKI